MEGSDECTDNNAVKINVGGNHFEVAPSLLERYPESMLATLLTDTWNEDPSKPIFIDRDGCIFAYVLNYLRYGSIELPAHLPKSMFERELDYYGISIDDESIEQSNSVGTLKVIKQRLRDLELDHDMLLIAAKCYSKYMSGRTTVRIRGGTGMGLRHSPYYYDDNDAMYTLNEYLLKFYGLRATRQKRLFASDLDYVLKIEEIVAKDFVATPTTASEEDSSVDFEVEVSGASSDLTDTPLLRGRPGPILSEEEFIRALDQAMMNDDSIIT